MLCSAGGRTANLITTARGPFVAGVASHPWWLKEIAISNTTDLAFAFTVQRITAVGTGGTGLTETCLDDDEYVPVNTAVNTPTADHTVDGGEIYRYNVGASEGSGIILPFRGIHVAGGTANGVAILLVSGETAQHFDFTFQWEE